MKCPGQDPRNWTDDSVFDEPCPQCGVEVEFFKDDKTRRCPGCGNRFANPRIDLGCAEWCPYAEECLGIAPDKKAAAPKGEGPLVASLVQAMKEVFGHDQKRIGHALRVFQFAKELLRTEGGDPRVVIAAAILHDIGIPAAERIHGSSAGPHQEAEGPPIARRIMADIQLEPDIIDHVCRIIGSHHSGRDIDTIEFRIVWDADWLVNLPDEQPDPAKHAAIIERVFKTPAGKRRAEGIYLK